MPPLKLSWLAAPPTIATVELMLNWEPLRANWMALDVVAAPPITTLLKVARPAVALAVEIKVVTFTVDETLGDEVVDDR